jgi:hypothetical protein
MDNPPTSLGTSEIKGTGNSINYMFSMHSLSRYYGNPRVGRFFAVDPLAPKYPHNSPYAFSENRLIDGVELEGLEFSGFNEYDVVASATERYLYPSVVYQGKTGTCGIAAITYIWIIEDRKGYYNTVLNLWKNGSASYNGYDIEPDSHLYSMSINNSEYPYSTNKTAYIADWIIISSLRDNENDLWDYDGEKVESKYDIDEFLGSTSIGTIKSLMKNLLGLSITDHNTSYLSHGVDNVATTLQDMENRFNNGEHEVLLINADLIRDPSNSSDTADHWVVYNGNLKVTTNSSGNAAYSFDVYSWGDIVPISVTEEEFNKNFYGSISGKK